MNFIKAMLVGKLCLKPDRDGNVILIWLIYFDIWLKVNFSFATVQIIQCNNIMQITFAKDCIWLSLYLQTYQTLLSGTEFPLWFSLHFLSCPSQSPAGCWEQSVASLSSSLHWKIWSLINTKVFYYVFLSNMRITSWVILYQFYYKHCVQCWILSD